MGDAMFLAAGTLWAGFGIVLRKHRLDPLLATAVISISALLSYVPAY
nr:EamA/RhaT family transporter [Betaproteobacteria bacterium]